MDTPGCYPDVEYWSGSGGEMTWLVLAAGLALAGQPAEITVTVTDAAGRPIPSAMLARW